LKTNRNKARRKRENYITKGLGNSLKILERREKKHIDIERGSLKLKIKRHSEVNIFGWRIILQRMIKNNVDYAAVAQQRRQQCALLNSAVQLWILLKDKTV
jgi:hypothetical protein